MWNRHTTARITNITQRKFIAQQITANIALSNINDIHEAMTQFATKKAFKVDGSKTKNLAIALKEHLPIYEEDKGYPDFPIYGYDIDKVRNHHTNISLSYKSIYYRVSIACYFGNEYFDEAMTRHSSSDFIYFETDLCIGSLNDDNSIELRPLIDLQEQLTKLTSQNYSYISDTQKEILQLKEKIEALKNTIPYYAK